MLSFLPVLTLIVNALGTALPLIPGVNSTISKTATDLATGVISLLSGIVPGVSSSQNVISALSGAEALLATLKADTSISPATLTLIDNLIGEIQAAIVAYVSAGTGFNAANYAPVAPVA